MEEVVIVELDQSNVLEYGLCGYKNIKRPGLEEKIDWLKSRMKEGLKIKTLVSNKTGSQGMIEYIPGEHCWRPVEAKSYMFTHCIFVGFKKEYKGKGYTSQLLRECEKEAKEKKMHGVAIVTRKGSFMVGRDLFLKRDFQVADKAPPDFELLVKKYNQIPLTHKYA